ncbi:putative bifunctional diguanylate cyclase/phosphodiesterase [Pleionea sediminis]|uniref:putative bifunctional diguanylate cyclase/phosphodiesterase n=1 Tax=Pleionea sediminis TaxID=2569479 RepID=UPI0013DDC1B8|nr:bifunctional diguanylate cyclase/phosphodiesterase [Pleionea sediminis]
MKLQFLVFNQELYEIIILPVKAPRIIGYSIIGFKFNDKVMSELKRLTSVDVSFLLENRIIISSFDKNNDYSLFNQEQPYFFIFKRDSYKNKIIEYSKAPYNISAQLSASLNSSYKAFDSLIFSSIGFSLLILFIGILTSRFMAGSLTKPLKALVSMTKEFAKGNYLSEDLKNKASVEVERLFRRFKTMGTEIASREREIKFQAEHDILTGLYNRYSLISKLGIILNRYRQILLISIDIRGFKGINDSLGATVGDKCLKAVADRLSSFSDCDDALHGRLSGDEFLSILAIKDKQTIEDVAKEFLDSLKEPFNIDDLKFSMNFFIGAAVYPRDGLSARDLIRRTTIALDAASQEEVALRYYKEGEDEAHLTRLKTIEQLRSVLSDDDGSLFMAYQPKLNLNSSTIDKVECLIRWNNNGEWISPEFFVDLAEKSGLIVELTHWVIRKVFQQVTQWKEEGISVHVAINVSAQDLSHPDFLEFLLEQLEEHEIKANQVTLELTERDIMNNEDRIITRLNHLKTIGISVSVDDYGIGQSSLNKLKQLPVDELKIDKSFIMTLSESEVDQKIVESTINLGHRLGMHVVAEGVENEESLKILETMKCDHIQGYFLSRPLNAEDFSQWYKKYE